MFNCSDDIKPLRVLSLDYSSDEMPPLSAFLPDKNALDPLEYLCRKSEIIEDEKKYYENKKKIISILKKNLTSKAFYFWYVYTFCNFTFAELKSLAKAEDLREYVAL